MTHRQLRDSILHLRETSPQALREQKVRLFLRSVGSACSGDRLLDVGGDLDDENSFSWYAAFRRSSSSTRHISLRRAKDLKAVRIAADGRNLPFESGSIDWVFSNAVIKHVGGGQDKNNLP